MATINKLHDTTALSASLVQMPDIEAALDAAANQLDLNLGWLDSDYVDIYFDDVDLSAYIVSTSTSFGYDGPMHVYREWYDPVTFDFFSEMVDANLVLSMAGSSLPVYAWTENPDDMDWIAPSAVKFTSIRMDLPEYGNALFSVTGSMTLTETSSVFSMKEIKFGDDNFMVTLTGNLTVKESASSSETQVSGGISGLKFDLLKDAGTEDDGDEVYFHVESGLKMSPASGTAVLTSFKVSEDVLGSAPNVLVEASKLNVNLVDADTSAPDFIKTVLLSGNDIITGTAEDDFLEAGAGNDKVDGGEGDDGIDGGAGNDKITDLSGNNTITDLEGNANIVTGGGNDTITTGTGNDKITAGEGNNDVVSGGGNDNITAGSGDDYVEAGDGNDKISVTGGNNDILGGAGNDTITLKGLAENANMISGGAGNDKINLTASLGADSVVFDSFIVGSKDTVSGFNAANDQLLFDASVFTSLGTLGAGNVRIGSGLKTAGDGDDYLIFDTKSGGLYYDADGNGTASAAVQIALVKGSIATMDMDNFGLLVT